MGFWSFIGDMLLFNWLFGKRKSRGSSLGNQVIYRERDYEVLPDSFERKNIHRPASGRRVPGWPVVPDPDDPDYEDYLDDLETYEGEFDDLDDLDTYDYMTDFNDYGGDLDSYDDDLDLYDEEFDTYDDFDD